METKAENAAEQGADAILLMGGTTNRLHESDIIQMLRRLSVILPVCLYSGSDDEEHDKDIAQKSGITWLKTGSYKAELGGLASPTTNQRFYKLNDLFVLDNKGNIVERDTIFHDLTYLFQKGDT